MTHKYLKVFLTHCLHMCAYELFYIVKSLIFVPNFDILKTWWSKV